ncbi:BRO-N domain-containing protein [Bifidobacterium longum]|uniref:BRO-N domain-containing protein n=1 Tax=Bifidobacterium longum TaxID=216816 RepID=UPI0032BF3985
MSNQIQPFDFNGIQVRVLTDEHGNPWFLGADVCAILGTATNHIREYLDADEITNIRSTDIAQNGGKAPVFVSESGLYSLVLRSRKPEAREFKRWVTHEVLPSIRKHGAYMTESTVTFSPACRGGGFLLKNPSGFSIDRLSPHALWFARFMSRATR